ncbi:MAG: hypothetical protein IT445_10785 [Phycisphaeraceae bacterium]|nr:hypothetical protein [Phycisphaeraceae bacterium]
MTVTHSRRHAFIYTGLLFCALAYAAGAGVAVPSRNDPEIVPRTSPELVEQSVEIEPDVWLSDQLEAEGAKVIWVKAIWGRNDDHWYDRWEQKAPWGDTSPWYITFPRIIWFQNKMVAMFTERNLPHGDGDAVIHVLTSDVNCEEWKTVAHYEIDWNNNGDNSTHFAPTTDGRLMLTTLCSMLPEGGMAASFSSDGVGWSPLKSFQPLDPQYGTVGQMFKIAWHNGSAYGLSRPGVLWTSNDGLNYQPIRVEIPTDGDVGGNETASTFQGDRWVVFSRSGYVASSLPPYTRWHVNKANSKGPHSFGGPDVITLPDGQVIAGSRGSGFRDLGGRFGGHMAVIFRYDGEVLTPLLGFETGATMTGYPGLTWADGHLYVSFLRDRPGRDGWSRSRGQFCLAKIKWPDIHTDQVSLPPE